MPTFKITSPEGKVYKVNAPEGATQEDAIAYIKNNQPKKAKMTDFYKQTAKDDTVLQNVLAGIGGGMTSLYQGGKQAIGLGDQAAIDEHRKAMEGLRSTGGGFAGDIIGQAALVAPVMAIPGANTYLGATAIGGGLGAMQPTLEGESRLLNTALGSVGGVAGKWGGDKLGKMLAGNKSAVLNPAKQKALNTGTRLGFKQTPGYSSGSKGLQKLEAQMESNPFFSRPIDAVKDHNQTRINQIAAKALGEKSDVLDSEVLGTIKTKIGAVYNKVANKTQRAIDPDDILNRLEIISNEYENMLPSDLLDQKLVSEFFKLAQKGQASGRQLQHLSSRIGRTAKNNMTTAAGDRELGKALFDFKEIVDDYLGSGLAPDLAEEFTKARGKYRTLMQLTTRNNIVNSASGDISPIALSNYLQKSDKPGYLFGGNKSDLYNAARFGQAFKPIVGDSGTATRSASNMDLTTMMGAPFTNLAARLYTTKPAVQGIGGFAQHGLLNLPEEAIQHLSNLGLLSGAVLGSQVQGR